MSGSDGLVSTAARAKSAPPPVSRPRRLIALALAAFAGPMVYLIGMNFQADNEIKPIDIHDLPAYYHGRRITWDQLDHKLLTTPRMVLEIDLRKVGGEQVILFDNEAQHQSWLCLKGYETQDC
jgi:hypothetical protein